MTSEPTKKVDDAIREQIREKLANGLNTEVFPRADTSDDINAIVGRLQTDAAGDLEKKLVISGWTDHTITHDEIEQPCETCMYYLVNRRFCNLPELMLPAEPEWSCRLWRI